jgi:tryptophan synthase alpha chain
MKPGSVAFEISTSEQARQMAALSDGAIVGYVIVKITEEHGRGRI